MENQSEFSGCANSYNKFVAIRSSYNMNYKHYRLCSFGLSKTETPHILLECYLTRASHQVMINSTTDVLLKEQVFTATWNRILLSGHVKLKRPSLLLYDAVFNFLQQLWCSCNDSYFLCWEPNFLLLTFCY